MTSFHIWGSIGFSVLFLTSLRAYSQLSFERSVIDKNVNGVVDIADIDGDGYNDVVLARGETAIYWYRYPAWERTTVVHLNYRCDDVAVCDIDADGDTDIIAVEDNDGSLSWLENPGPSGNPRTDMWKKHDIQAGGVGYVKDIEAVDMNGDTIKDIVVRGHTETAIFIQSTLHEWNKLKTISHASKEGMAIGDMDDDNDPDIVLNGFWIETPDNPANGNWNQHEIDDYWYTQHTGHWSDNNSMACVADINDDGNADAIFSHSGTKNHPVNWYEAEDPKGSWSKHEIDSRVDFCQTLQAADMDNDGDNDIVAAVSGGYKNGQEDIIVFVNESNGAKWTRHVLATTGGYSLVTGDIDNDGDMDIVGERSHKYPPTELWRNMIIRGQNTGSGEFCVFKPNASSRRACFSREILSRYHYFTGGISHIYDIRGVLLYKNKSAAPGYHRLRATSTQVFIAGKR